ncbi:MULTISPECIES: hypothetical protein [Bacillus cereus group]|uniref:hypothetical protein n=1 Tax=Bacillus cereus group TaxID=86661 RepID=UPI000BF7862D|nr:MULTISPECIES: hypothetical protein [Bacillus cereus group]PFL28104.1 hypothetical protein COJ26_27810 [Bacillus thuringiensis]PGQ52641.1 hypothetical protein COA22_21465 [Bacillus cereus]PGY40627.1 hypothetical protein COE10_18895 [Bacillus cereus]
MKELKTNRVTASAGTETVNIKKEETMKQIINSFIENDWTYEEAIAFLSEIELLLNKMATTHRVSQP